MMSADAVAANQVVTPPSDDMQQVQGGVGCAPPAFKVQTTEGAKRYPWEDEIVSLLGL